MKHYKKIKEKFNQYKLPVSISIGKITIEIHSSVLLVTGFFTGLALGINAT